MELVCFEFKLYKRNAKILTILNVFVENSDEVISVRSRLFVEVTQSVNVFVHDGSN